MSGTYYRERVGVRSSEAVIDRKELERLRTMARRGADYENAAKEMRNRFVEIIEKRKDAEANGASDTVIWCSGWLASMRELSEMIVRPG